MDIQYRLADFRLMYLTRALYPKLFPTSLWVDIVVSCHKNDIIAKKAAGLLTPLSLLYTQKKIAHFFIFAKNSKPVLGIKIHMCMCSLQTVSVSSVFVCM